MHVLDTIVIESVHNSSISGVQWSTRKQQNHITHSYHAS